MPSRSSLGVLLLVPLLALAPWSVLASSNTGSPTGDCDETRTQEVNETSSPYGETRSSYEERKRSCSGGTTYLAVEDERVPANASVTEAQWERERATERRSASSWTIGDAHTEGQSTQRSSEGGSGWEQRGELRSSAAHAAASRGCQQTWNEGTDRSSGSSTGPMGNMSGANQGHRSAASDRCHTALEVHGPAGPLTVEHEEATWERAASREGTSQRENGPYRDQQTRTRERAQGDRQALTVQGLDHRASLERACWASSAEEEHEAWGDGSSHERFHRRSGEDGCWTGASANGPAGPASVGHQDRCVSNASSYESEGGFVGERRSARSSTACRTGAVVNATGDRVWLGHQDACSRSALGSESFEQRQQRCREGVVLEQGPNETFVGRGSGCEYAAHQLEMGSVSSAEDASRCWSDARVETGGEQASVGTWCWRSNSTFTSDDVRYATRTEGCRTGLTVGPHDQAGLFAGLEGSCWEHEAGAGGTRVQRCSEGLSLQVQEREPLHAGRSCWNTSFGADGSHGCRTGASVNVEGTGAFVGADDSCHDRGVHRERQPGNETRCYEGPALETTATTLRAGTRCIEEDGRTPSGRSASTSCTEGAMVSTPAGEVVVGERTACSNTHGTAYNVTHDGRSCEKGVVAEGPGAGASLGWRCSQGEVSMDNETSRGRGCDQGLRVTGPTGTWAKAGSRERCHDAAGPPEPCQEREGREHGASAGTSTPAGAVGVERWEDTTELP